MCDGCARWQERFNALLIDKENLQAEHLADLRRIKQLQKKIDDLREHDPAMHVAQDVFAYWVAACRSGPGHKPEQVKFGTARQKAVLGILKLGIPPERIKRAIDGAALDPYIDPKGKVHDELELICRNEVKLDSFIERAERAEKAGMNLSATELWERLCNYAGQPNRHVELDAFHFRCLCCVTPETLQDRPLVVTVRYDGLRIFCRSCKADETKLRAELARRKREEVKLMQVMREEMQAA